LLRKENSVVIIWIEGDVRNPHEERKEECSEERTKKFFLVKIFVVQLHFVRITK